MKPIKPGRWLLPLSLLLFVTACSLPFMATPTPFVFPTPDMTMTALFAPTATLEPTETEFPTITPTFTETAQPSPSEEPPTATMEPSKTPTLEPYNPPPPAQRDGPYFEAQYVKHQPELDGGWSDWDTEIYAADLVVYGKDNWKGADDLSATFKVHWDEDYLYIAWKVRDDKYVQYSKGENLYLGDSVEVLVDTAVQYDYWNNWLDWDDYQIGISPGRNEPGENMEAYLWFPSGKARSLPKVIIGAVSTDNGYRVSAAIPWSTLGIDPYEGMRLGFAASVSDDDSKKGKEQQSMVSSSWRRLTDPTTWGDLVLIK